MSSSSDDEWGAAELDIPSKPKVNHIDDGNGSGDDDWDVKGKHLQAVAADDDGDDEEWMPKAKISNPTDDTDTKPSNKKKSDNGGTPMILIDLTRLDPAIHSKFDKNGVSDSAAASALRKKIESQYKQYSKDARLLADGTVIPCSTSVWRGAIQRMRDERPGHYFAPIFPPPSAKK